MGQNGSKDSVSEEVEQQKIGGFKLNEFEVDDDFGLTIEDIINENNKHLGFWDRIQPTN